MLVNFGCVNQKWLFADLEDIINLMEDMVKSCIEYVFANCPEEMKFSTILSIKTKL